MEKSQTCREAGTESHGSQGGSRAAYHFELPQTVSFPTIHTHFTLFLSGYKVLSMKNIKTIFRFLGLLSLFTSVLFAGASYSCPGESVKYINGATKSAAESYDTKDKPVGNEGGRYWKFKTKVDGTITIMQNTLKNVQDYRNHQLLVGTSCDGSDIYQGQVSTVDSTTFPVQKNKTYYVKIKERNYKNQLNVHVSFVFTKQGESGCTGCDCKYDTGNNEIFNDTPPGVEIAELNNKTTQEQKCFSGISVSGSGHNEDNFYFIAGADGDVSINTSSPNMHKYHMKVTRGSTVVYKDVKKINHSVNFKVTKGDRVVLYFKETGEDADKYEATVTFKPKITVLHATDDSYTTPVNQNIIMDVTTNDIAGQHPPIKNIIITTKPSHGTATINGLMIEYTPDNNYKGVDTLKYVIQDSASPQQTSNEASVVINIGTSVYNRGDRPFTVRNPKPTRNIVGDYAIIGNSSQCAINSTSTSAPWIGGCVQSYRNDLASRYIDIDADASTKNSSSSTLNIPKGAEVVWAGLYWQGVVHNSIVNGDFMGSSGKADGQTISGEPGFGSGKQIDFKYAKGKTYGAERVKLKLPGGNYQEVVADVLDFHDLGYAGFKDITALVNKTNPNGVYTVADIKSNQGVETNHGNYAAWSIVIIYKDDNSKFKNISVFDGYATVDENFAQDLVMSGFLTSKKPPIKSKLAMFAMDGDNGKNSFSVLSQGGVSTTIQNQDHPSNSLFDSTISNSINRNPSATSLRTDLKVLDLVDVLGPSESKATLKPRSGGDRYTPSFFIMSAELRTLNLCYDFTYGQNGHFQTAPTIKPPKIEAQVYTGDPLDVKLYFKNLEKDTDVTAKHITVDIIDINTTQATYKRDSTYVTRPNTATQIAEPDSGRRVSDSFDKDISIGDLGGLEYFYTYYSLEPKKSTIDMMLNAFLRYDLTVNIGGSTITLSNAHTHIKDMNPCQASNAYKPVPGRFNVVHQAYKNTNLSSGYYYNIPTQVVKRYTDNFVVESMNPNDLNATKAISTADALEMVEMDGFHYVTATCTDVNATVLSKKRLWVIFDSNTSAFKPLTKTDLEHAGFFDNASRNAAFRLAYNVADANDSVIQLSKNASGKYTMLNFSNYAGANCASSFVSSTGSRGGKVSDYCGSGAGKSGNGMNANELRECMECIFSINTFRMCSRDNFAIRPEAFKLMFSDQNQTNPSQLISLGNTATKLDLASGYDYKAEVNATSHVDDNATPGYYGAGSTLTLQWNSTKPAGACNDTNDVDVNVSIINGRGTGDVVLNQVGEYKLHLEDKDWTAADWRYLAHHSGKYFANGTDCIANSHAVAKASTMKKNGCVISSEHNNSEFSALKYFDYTMEFHPYKFDISSIVSSVGLDDSNVTTNAFVYNANMDENASGNYDDINMSYHLYGSVVAQGENNATLSNFVSGCYAKDIKIVLPRSAYADTSMTFKGSVETLDGSNNRLTIVFEDVNNSKDFVDVSKNAFAKSLNGTANVRIRYNFKRDINESKNPQTITFKKLSVGCKNVAECRSKADLGDHDVNASSFKDINETIRFYYARAYVPDSKIIGNSGTVKGHYEIYCSGSGCNKALLPQGAASKGSDDPRWWINESHTSGYGKMKVIKQKRTPVHVTLNGASPSGSATENIPLLYDEQRGYPYKATMKIIPNRWLIYNKYNANADHNEFDVKFEGNGEWAGKNSSKSATSTSNADKSRILQW